MKKRLFILSLIIMFTAASAGCGAQPPYVAMDSAVVEELPEATQDVPEETLEETAEESLLRGTGPVSQESSVRQESEKTSLNKESSTLAASRGTETSFQEESGSLESSFETLEETELSTQEISEDEYRPLAASSLEEVSLARKEAEAEAARKASEEAARKASEEAAKKASEKAAKKASEEAAKKASEEAAKKASEEAARASSEAAAATTTPPTEPETEPPYVANGKTVLIGDSRFAEFRNTGLVPAEQVCGFPGCTFAWILDDYNWNTALVAAANTHPAKAIFGGGINDAGVYGSYISTVIADYQAAIDLFLSYSPNTQIYVNAIIPATEEAIKAYPGRALVPEYNAAFQRMCAERGWIYIDANGGFNDSYYVDDGIHLLWSWYPIWLNNFQSIVGGI